MLGRLGSRSTLSRRWKRILALSHKRLLGPFSGKLEWWIGRGYPLSPYLKGLLVERIRAGTKLKQLSPPPDEEWWSMGERDNSEYTLLRNWMELWLKYLLRYARIHLDPDPTLHDLFNPPFVTFSYHTDRTQEVTQSVKAWGLLYRLYDESEGKAYPGWTPPCIEQSVYGPC